MANSSPCLSWLHSWQYLLIYRKQAINMTYGQRMRWEREKDLTWSPYILESLNPCHSNKKLNIKVKKRLFLALNVIIFSTEGSHVCKWTQCSASLQLQVIPVIFFLIILIIFLITCQHAFSSTEPNLAALKDKMLFNIQLKRTLCLKVKGPIWSSGGLRFCFLQIFYILIYNISYNLWMKYQNCVCLSPEQNEWNLTAVNKL